MMAMDKTMIGPIGISSTKEIDYENEKPELINNTTTETLVNKHSSQIGEGSSQGRQRSGDVQQMCIAKSVSLQNNDKPLHQSEKPWKPTQKLLSARELTENRKSLAAEVNFILNRLTPTNFERLATEMRKLNIQTYEDLQELVQIFINHVSKDTKYVEAYALLSKIMSGLKVPPSPGMKANQATFRVVLLTKCQQEFEADKSIIFEDPEEKKRKIESEMPEGPERNQLIEITLHLMKLRRLKHHCNTRLMGELFKLGMLTENIMHDCIFRLLKARDDDSLVSLCQLLTTVGHALDTDKAKTRMDQYFFEMTKFAEEKKSTVKFALKDVIDLRSNNWVPRKEQAGPKKIPPKNNDVLCDLLEDRFNKQLMRFQHRPSGNDQAQPKSHRGSRRQDENKKALDANKKTLSIDTSEMQLSKHKSLESKVLNIMDRITPSNFESLATEMRNLKVKSYEDLQRLVNFFFDKVTMDTKLIEVYALLCKVMSALKVPPPPGMKANQATFRVVMLTKCQQEFEADKSIIFQDPEEKKRKIESEMPEGNERNQLIESTLYLMKLKRLKFYGNIRFIGELFKLGMLTENIMHDCIFRLLKARDDDSLVSLCQLLTTVGHALDTDKAKARMDQYFHQMAKMAEDKKSSTKQALKDAIDLRCNNWVPQNH